MGPPVHKRPDPCATPAAYGRNGTRLDRVRIRVKRMTMATDAGHPGRTNEDFAGAVPYGLVLVDGAGGIAGALGHGGARPRRLGGPTGLPGWLLGVGGHCTWEATGWARVVHRWAGLFSMSGPSSGHVDGGERFAP